MLLALESRVMHQAFNKEDKMAHTRMQEENGLNSAQGPKAFCLADGIIGRPIDTMAEIMDSETSGIAGSPEAEVPTVCCDV